jgi:hypothetical protein
MTKRVAASPSSSSDTKMLFWLFSFVGASGCDALSARNYSPLQYCNLFCHALSHVQASKTSKKDTDGKKLSRNMLKKQHAGLLPGLGKCIERHEPLICLLHA